MDSDDLTKQENAGPGNFGPLPQEAEFMVENLRETDIQQVRKYYIVYHIMNVTLGLIKFISDQNKLFYVYYTH